MQKEMNSEYGMFTEAQVREMAERGDTTVYKNDYTTQFDPYPTDEVNDCIDKLLNLMKSKANIEDAVLKDAKLKDFSEKYQVIYKNLTDKDFIAKPQNVSTVRRLVSLKARMDRGEIGEDAARTQCSTIALETTIKKK